MHRRRRKHLPAHSVSLWYASLDSMRITAAASCRCIKWRAALAVWRLLRCLRFRPDKTPLLPTSPQPTRFAKVRCMAKKISRAKAVDPTVLFKLLADKRRYRAIGLLIDARKGLLVGES